MTVRRLSLIIIICLGLSMPPALWAAEGLPDMPYPAIAVDEPSGRSSALSETADNSRSMRERQAEIGAEIARLADQINKLRGELEEIKRNSEQLGNERRNLQAELDALTDRMRKIENRSGIAAIKPVEKTGKSGEAPVAAAVDGKAATTDPKAAYPEAYNIFKSGRYGEARGKFQAFIRQFPDRTLASNAQFWIGESHYAEENIEKAILEYEKVIKNYPKGDMVPPALLKQGLGLLKLGDVTGAKIVLQKLASEYPETHQGRIAKAKLPTLK